MLGKLGVSLGYERRSCVPAGSTEEMILRAGALGRSPHQEPIADVDEPGSDSFGARERAARDGSTSDSSASNGSVAASRLPPCAELARCPSHYRRYARSVRYVGGYYGGGSEEALIAELQHGPVAVSLYAEPEFALYRDGVYHALERDRWMRNVGRTLPAFDPSSCHSGCAPPEHIEWQATNYGALLVGYGTQSGPGNASAPFWILQLPWGTGWGENGTIRVLRGEAAIESAALVVEPLI